MNANSRLRFGAAAAALLVSLFLPAFTASGARQVAFSSRHGGYAGWQRALHCLRHRRAGARVRSGREAGGPSPSLHLHHPVGLALSPGGRTLLVTCAGPESQVGMVDVVKGRIVAKLRAGHTAMSPVVSPTARPCSSATGSTMTLALLTWPPRRRFGVFRCREPVAAAITPDGRHLLVANYLPHGRADVDHVGAVVSVIDTALGQVVDDLWLPNGSSSLQDIRISPAWRYAVVTDILSRASICRRRNWSAAG